MKKQADLIKGSSSTKLLNFNFIENMKDLQLPQLFDAFDKLQQIHGDKNLLSVYGAGCIKQPKLFLLFMNPTGRNVSCIP